MSVEKEFNIDVLTILSQTQAIGGSAKVHLVDQSDEGGLYLLELWRGQPAVQQKENICKFFFQS